MENIVLLPEGGITTEAKTGTLTMDEAKVRQALAEDYDSVATLFVRSKGLVGAADRLASAIKGLKDPERGVLKAKVRGLDEIIKNSDRDIKRKERTAEQKEESIRRRFSSLEGQLSDLKSQGDFLASKFAGGGGGGKG